MSPDALESPFARLPPEALDRARQVATRSGRRLPAVLVELGLIPESDLANQLAGSKGLDLLAAEAMTCPANAELNPAFMKRRAVLPTETTDAGYRLAMADPGDDDAWRALSFALGAHDLPRAVATFSDIEEAIAKLDPEPATADALDWQIDADQLDDAGSDAPVIRLVQQLIASAAAKRASDIHIEPAQHHVAVRYRIDGRLNEMDRLNAMLGAPVVSRIKVMAGLDIAETRLPQDGRLRVAVRGRDVDVRVATSPTAHGESVVMRLLGQSTLPLNLEKLGLPPRALARLIAALERPHGIVLLTGPTGSGKTTTLYAAINRLRRPDVKILTVEDPVEILIEGINQVQVRPEIDLTYATALRAFLRQDPDILMIGEIRDHETAEIAMRAALTGHLVLSTLHTNSATGAFTRLADIGIAPYLTASTVIATVAQRLVRTLCQDCATSRAPSGEEAQLFAGAGLPAPTLLQEPEGCRHCASSGYRGRVPVIEIFEIDEHAREHIRTGAIDQLVQWQEDTLVAHGLELVAAGVTSLSEIQRAILLT